MKTLEQVSNKTVRISLRSARLNPGAADCDDKIDTSMPSETAMETAAQAVDSPENPRSSALPTKVGFVSLGCPKNLVDSEVMMGILATSGAELTTRAED